MLLVLAAEEKLLVNKILTVRRLLYCQVRFFLFSTVNLVCFNDQLQSFPTFKSRHKEWKVQ